MSYTVGGQAVAPVWLEPQWLFPDWATNSDFRVVTPMTQTGANADNLPIAESVIANDELEITLRYEMLDTVSGTPMGTTPASATGTPVALPSNRYVLKQTATVRNISGSTIGNLRFYQLLHGLSSQRGVYDNRLHGGPLSNFLHDVTLAGVDPWSAGNNTSSAGLEDFIGFHSVTAPDAFEIGYYGIEGNGVDDHGIGKPSDGVHKSIENDWQSAPYLSRQGTDSFAPAQHWVAGAQRWSLGSLGAGQAASHEILLTILTGTKVPTGTGSSGSCNGGSGVPGGIDYQFDDVSTDGSCFGSFSRADDEELQIRVANGEFDDFTFPTPGKPAQIWDVEFNGSFTGNVDLVFCYDDTLLPTGFAEEDLAVYQFLGGTWHKCAGTSDPLANTVSVSTTAVGHFALGVDGATTVNHVITVSPSPVQGGTVTGAGTYAAGSAVSLVAAAANGFAFMQWTENGTPVSDSPNLGFIATADRDLTAVFVAVGSGKAINTSSTPANGGTTSGGGAWPVGANVTVNATPAPGYKFSKWLENGVVVSTAKNYSFTVSTDRTLVAKFKPVYTIEASPVPEEGGETEADPVYEPGELAKLKAKPNDGWSFVNWTQNGVVVSTQPNFQFNVTGNRVLVAHFAPGNRIDATAEPANAGSVAGAGVIESGISVTLSATAKAGYAFLNWSEGGSPVSTEASYTFTSSASRVLVANFIALPSIGSRAEAGGTMVFSWPAGANGWILEENPGLDAAGWSESTRPVSVNGDRKEVRITDPAGSAFFRLTHP